MKKCFYILIFASGLLSSCTYLKYSGVQSEYERIQKADPSLVNMRHMLNKEKFFVFGKVTGDSSMLMDRSILVVAYSNKFKQHELVDSMQLSVIGTHYGLNLPSGLYKLLVYADLDKNGVFENNEVVGQLDLNLNEAANENKVQGHVDLELSHYRKIDWANNIPVSVKTESETSYIYPSGTIRSLDDPIFDEKIATLGMYDPASFLEKAPTMFHALDEDTAHKIPVVMVHGIGASPRSFEKIIKKLDHNRYRIWFYYYPSGGDLNQLATLFYDIYLSGKVIPLGDMPMIVVAHSMGGLVVREAINQYQGVKNENKIKLLVTIATPLGGHPSAAKGEAHGLLVLPAWRDLNPSSQFIKQLYKKPLPDFISHSLYYAFNNNKSIKLGENSDGVVPLTSQLHPIAQSQSDQQFGFNSSHTSILESDFMIDRLTQLMGGVKSIFPDDHMAVLARGGFDVKLGDEYSLETKNLISYAGIYIMMLIDGKIKPFHPDQLRFIEVLNSQSEATTRLEREFVKLLKEYPEWVQLVK